MLERKYVLMLVHVDRFMNDVAGVAALKPNALDKIDEDKLVDVLARVRGVTPEIIRNERDILAIREQRAEAQAKIEQQADIAATADVAKTASEAQKKLVAK